MTLPRLIACVATALALTGSNVSFALAQTAAQDTEAGPRIALSPAQRQTIYQSVSATQKNHAAPTGFRVAIGGIVPSAIALAPMPNTLETLLPQVGAYEVALIEKQVVLVDPQTRQVADVIRGENP